MSGPSLLQYKQILNDMRAIDKLLDGLTGDDEKDAWAMEAVAYIAAQYKEKK